MLTYEVKNQITVTQSAVFNIFSSRIIVSFCYSITGTAVSPALSNIFGKSLFPTDTDRGNQPDNQMKAFNMNDYYIWKLEVG